MHEKNALLYASCHCTEKCALTWTWKQCISACNNASLQFFQDIIIYKLQQNTLQIYIKNKCKYTKHCALYNKLFLILTDNSQLKSLKDLIFSHHRLINPVLMPPSPPPTGSHTALWVQDLGLVPTGSASNGLWKRRARVLQPPTSTRTIIQIYKRILIGAVWQHQSKVWMHLTECFRS